MMLDANLREMTRDINSFLDRVANDECLQAWFLGQLSDTEILDRLAYLKRVEEPREAIS